jgi:hypothetical protein
MPGHNLRSALGESRFAFCALRMRSLFFQRWLVHGQRGGHNRVACCGDQIIVGRKTLKYSFTVGDGVLAELKCVIHARLPSVLSLRKRDRGPVQGDNNDEHDSLLHRGPSLRSTAMSTSPRGNPRAARLWFTAHRAYRGRPCRLRVNRVVG